MVGEGEGDGQLWGSGRGAIAGCHCSVLWWGKGRVTANFAGVDVVPLGCHCSVLWLGKGRVKANFGGVDVVPWAECPWFTAHQWSSGSLPAMAPNNGTQSTPPPSPP